MRTNVRISFYYGKGYRKDKGASMKEEEYNFIKRFVDKRIRDRMIMEHENDIEMRHGKEYIYRNRHRYKAIQRFNSISSVIPSN